MVVIYLFQPTSLVCMSLFWPLNTTTITRATTLFNLTHFYSFFSHKNFQYISFLLSMSQLLLFIYFSFIPTHLSPHFQVLSIFLQFVIWEDFSWLMLLNFQLNTITNHHHHVVPLAQISLTLSRHFSLSFITSGRSSGLHPVSSHSCCMYVRAGHPAFARPYAGVHRSTSLMSSSLLLQQCPACLVHLTWIVFMIGGRWLYSWSLVGCCRQDLFNIACNLLV